MRKSTVRLRVTHFGRKMKVAWLLLEPLFLTILLQVFTGKTEAVLWRAEEGVNYYSSYESVTPARFSIPSNQREAVWHFRATKSPSSCDDKAISIYLQFGSLPAVNPLNETFPDRFFLGRSHLSELSVTSDNVSVPHTEQFPQGGDWYTIALIPQLNTHITQKGLTVSCEYNFSASLELKELPPYLHVSVNRVSWVALTGSHGDGDWVGFTVPTSATAVTLDIWNCTLPSCELQLFTVDDKTGQQMTHNCSNVDTSNCSLSFDTPLLGAMHYVHLQLLSSDNASVAIDIRTEDCGDGGESTNSAGSCQLEPRLDRYQEPGDYNTKFVHLDNNNTVQENEFLLSNASVTTVPFTVQRTTDVGGTLVVKVAFKKKDVAGDQLVRVCGQIAVDRFPVWNDGLDLCSNVTNGLRVNSSSEGEDGSVTGAVYVPYPEEGLWVLAMGMQCYNTTNRSSEAVDCVNGTQKVVVNVKIDKCLDGGCNGHGECREYIKSSDFIVFSSCACAAGWRGYGCTDGREAFSDTSQLIEVLLLTLSNLFFFPAIIVALYRRHYIEAVVYFYNMFTSAFYHACDGDRIDKYVYCLTKYSVLATGDFLASTCSLWVTLIAMARIPLDFSSAAQMAGPLALIMGVLLDRHSLWIIAVPTAVGLLLVAVSWALRCCNYRHCFPERRHYLWMLPGVLFAVAGAVMFAFFETAKNYKYIHSAWHVCLSLSIIFLLPLRRKRKVKTSVNFDGTDADSTEGLVLGPNAYNRRMNFEL